MTSVEAPLASSDGPGRRVDPSELPHIEIIETNERHASAPPFKKLNYVKERCECKRRGYDCAGQECLNRAMRQECTGSTCGLNKEECLNRCMQKRSWRDVEIRDCGSKGHGLFAAEDIGADSFVMEYHGEIIGESEFVRRSTESGHRYFMALDDGEYLDPSRRGSIGRFMNHSCEPNCTMEIWTVKGELRACVYTKKAVDRNQELTFDYGWEPMARKPLTKCLCETPSCRLFVEDWPAFDPNPAAHRLGTWEVPPGAPLGLHHQLPTYGQAPKRDFDASLGIAIKPKHWPVDERLVERRVRVWWDGNEDWFEADVVAYDKDTKLHLVQYCADAEQTYEDLASYVERGLKTTVEMGQYRSSTKEGDDKQGVAEGGDDGEEQKASATTPEAAATAAVVTKAAAASSYEGLLFGGPCDAVKFLKKKGGAPVNGQQEEGREEGEVEEATCSIWELLNENEKATPDMVLAPETPVVIPKRMKEKRRQSSPSSSGSAQCPPLLLQQSKLRKSGFRRTLGGGGGLGSSNDVAAGREALAFYRQEQAAKQAALAKQASTNAALMRQGLLTASSSSASSGSPPGSYNNYNNANSGSPNAGSGSVIITPAPPATAIVSCPSGDAIVNFGNLDVKTKSLWVGTFQLRNDGDSPVAFRVKLAAPLVEPSSPPTPASSYPRTPYGDAWAATLLPFVENRASPPSSLSNGNISSNGNGSGSSGLPLMHHSTKEETWPLPEPPSVAPAFGLLLPGQSVTVRFNALRDDAAKLRQLLLAGGPAAHAHEEEEEAAAAGDVVSSSSSSNGTSHSSSNGAGDGSSSHSGSSGNGATNDSIGGSDAATWPKRCGIVRRWCNGPSAKLWYGVDALALRPEDDANAVQHGGPRAAQRLFDDIAYDLAEYRGKDTSPPRDDWRSSSSSSSSSRRKKVPDLSPCAPIRLTSKYLASSGNKSSTTTASSSSSAAAAAGEVVRGPHCRLPVACTFRIDVEALLSGEEALHKEAAKKEALLKKAMKQVERQQQKQRDEYEGKNSRSSNGIDKSKRRSSGEKETQEERRRRKENSRHRGDDGRHRARPEDEEARRKRKEREAEKASNEKARTEEVLDDKARDDKTTNADGDPTTSSESAKNTASPSLKRPREEDSSSNNTKTSKSRSSSSGGSRPLALSSVDLRNVGDLSETAVRAGWRMKYSSTRNNKPYFYRLKHESDVLWSRSEMETRVKEWVKARKDRKKAEAAAAAADSGGEGNNTAHSDATEITGDAEWAIETVAAIKEVYDPFAVVDGDKAARVSDDEMNMSD